LQLVGPEARVTPRRIVGLVLVIIGLISLLWGGISWTREKTIVDIGPIEARSQERETIPLPPIVGGLALVAGAVLLVVRERSRV
jgi:hypothetical protein